MDQPASTPDTTADPPPRHPSRTQRLLLDLRRRDWIGVTIELGIVVAAS